MPLLLLDLSVLCGEESFDSVFQQWEELQIQYCPHTHHSTQAPLSWEWREESVEVSGT